MTQKPSPLRLSSFLLLFLVFLLLMWGACTPAETGETCSPDRTTSTYDIARASGYEAYDNLEDALICSRESGKPILLMFSAWAAIADHSLPWRILEVPEVREVISEHYLLVVLHVDDRSPLDSTQTDANLKTIGHKNAQFQIEHFQSNTQPSYYLLDAEQNVLGDQMGYTPVDRKVQFLHFLQQGIAKG